MPMISIIVPIYKVEPYIHRCVDSILAQTYTDFELILVDDGSPDSCGAICDGYAEKDSRIHVIHQENGGLSAARNAGIDWAFANSDSEWLYFADSDDWIHPKSLEALVNGAEQTGLSVVIGGFERTEGESPNVDEAALSATVCDTEEYFCEHNVNATVAWGKIYRKECFEDVRYPIGKIHEDEFTTYKILFEFDKLAVIDQPLYAYYQNPNGIMGKAWSPKNLDAVQARQEQLAYFEKAQYPAAHKEVVRRFLRELAYHITMLASFDDEQAEYNERCLRHQLRILLMKYYLHCPISRRNFYIYLSAFPKLNYVLRLYHKVKMLCRK